MGTLTYHSVYSKIEILKGTLKASESSADGYNSEKLDFYPINSFWRSKDFVLVTLNRADGVSPSK